MAVRQVKGRSSWKKFSAAFSESLADAGEQCTGFGRRILTETCEEWLHKYDSQWPHHTTVTKIRWGKNNVQRQMFGGDTFHPWYLGHLHDSVFVRIADGNRTISIQYMPQSASGAQHASSKDAGRTYTHIIGHDFAVQEAHNAEYVFLPGVQMQLGVGVPYARKVNESTRHHGFIEVMRADFFSDIEDRLMDVFGDNPKYRSRVFVPKK